MTSSICKNIVAKFERTHYYAFGFSILKMRKMRGYDALRCMQFLNGKGKVLFFRIGTLMINFHFARKYVMWTLCLFNKIIITIFTLMGSIFVYWKLQDFTQMPNKAFNSFNDVLWTMFDLNQIKMQKRKRKIIFFFLEFSVTIQSEAICIAIKSWYTNCNSK